jgi:hypothetical protein
VKRSSAGDWPDRSRGPLLRRAGLVRLIEGAHPAYRSGALVFVIPIASGVLDGVGLARSLVRSSGVALGPPCRSPGVGGGPDGDVHRGRSPRSRSPRLPAPARRRPIALGPASFRPTARLPPCRPLRPSPRSHPGRRQLQRPYRSARRPRRTRRRQARHQLRPRSRRPLRPRPRRRAQLRPRRHPQLPRQRLRQRRLGRPRSP